MCIFSKPKRTVVAPLPPAPPPDPPTPANPAGRPEDAYQKVERKVADAPPKPKPKPKPATATATPRYQRVGASKSGVSLPEM